jgi:hypothetical protein
VRRKIELVAADVERLRVVGGTGEFVLGLYRLLHRIDRDPELSPVIRREGEAAVERRAAFQFADEACVNQLVTLRGDFAGAVQRVPGAANLDDSAMVKPDAILPESIAYDFSLANFDEVAAQSRVVLFPSSRSDISDPSRTSTLLNILAGKSQQLREAAEAAGDDEKRDAALSDLARRLGNISRQHEHAYHRFLIDSRTLPGLAFGRLGLVINALNPEPIMVESGEDNDRLMQAAFGLVLSAGWAAQKAVFGGRAGEVSEFERDLMVSEAQQSLDLVVEGLRWAAAESPEGVATPTVQIGGDVIGALAVTSGPVTQNVSQQSVEIENYWESLRGELLEAGLPDDEVQALRTALEEDAAGVDTEGPGGATRRWLGRLGSKVTDGAVTVSLQLVAELIKKHVGLGL